MKCIAMLIIFTCNLFQYNNAVEKIPKYQLYSIFEAHLKKNKVHRPLLTGLNSQNSLKHFETILEMALFLYIDI